MMHLLQNHDTVLSALDYLRSVPRLGRNNLVLTDLQGDMVVFEIGHRRCRRRVSSPGWDPGEHQSLCQP